MGNTATRRPFVYLASRSPRRRALLRQIGVRFRSVAVEVDERRRRAEPPEDLVVRLARAKAQAARAAYGSRHPVLAADTVVVLDQSVLGKPSSRADAMTMLARLSGRVHRVLTAVAVTAQRLGDRPAARLSETRVWFRALGDHERRAYCATAEPMDKAGAYAIQGRAAAFVTRIEGSYSAVVGLPLAETCEMLAEIGLHVLAEP